MLETDLLVTQATRPMYGNGKSKQPISEKRRRRNDWMENNHNKWFENFHYTVLVIHKLRCHVKSLAEEARIIRKEERRCSLLYSGILREHRIGVLRTEARYAQLALAFIRGRPYRVAENSNIHQPVSVERLSSKIAEFFTFGGAKFVAPKVIEWLITGKTND